MIEKIQESYVSSVPNSAESVIKYIIKAEGDSLLGLLVQPLRMHDGTYIVPGAFAICGTDTFDASGKPFIKKSGNSGQEYMQAHGILTKTLEDACAGQIDHSKNALPIWRYDLPPIETA